MCPNSPSLQPINRRAWIKQSSACGALALAASTLPASVLAQGDGASPLAVVQIADMSPLQQDIGRDFLIGSRTAWQEFNAKGGIKGKPVQHIVLETDGSAKALQSAWQSAMANSACVALSGCVGDSAAVATATLQRSAGNGANALPLVAPWLHRQWVDNHNSVFRVFPDYQAQITHALKSLAVMGVKQAGVVYATPALQQQLSETLELAGRAEGLKLQVVPVNQRPTSPPPLILFIGGTPELHAFANQMGVPKGSHCYLIALADVNLQVLTQLGGVPRNISVVVTQPVPLVNAGLPVVRSYRTALGKFFDEPPSPQGLAGYIAARYTAEILAGLPTPVTRASALAAFRRRTDTTIGGFLISWQGEKPSGANVTQSMLTSDGRIVG